MIIAFVVELQQDRSILTAKSPPNREIKNILSKVKQ